MNRTHKQPSWQQDEQQRNRSHNGQYEKGPTCRCCGRPAKHDYASHELTDTTDASGVEWGDIALILCDPCASATADIKLVSEFLAYSRERKRQRLADKRRREGKKPPRSKGSAARNAVRR